MKTALEKMDEETRELVTKRIDDEIKEVAKQDKTDYATAACKVLNKDPGKHDHYRRYVSVPVGATAKE